MRRARLRPALVAALAAAVIPAALAAAAPSTNATSKAGGTSAAALPRVGAPLVTNARNTILTGGQIRGVILGAIDDDPRPLIADFPRLHALGVNLVSIYIYTYMDDYRSSTVSLNGPHSMSDATLKVLTSAAHAAGLAVQYSPVIWIRNNPTIWRGVIKPANVSEWFYSYGLMINHYMTLAKQSSVEVFSIGSELNSMDIWTSRWQALAAQANSGYAGLTTYMTTPFQMPRVAWWASVDLISGSAYYSLSSTPGPSVASMVGTWNRYLPQLKALSDKYHRPLLIDEIGYASVVGTTIHPAIAYREGRPPSMNEQANAYAALLAAARSQTSWLRGIVWWNFAQYSGTPSTNREFSMRGKKAECVLAKNWSSHTLPQLAAAGMIPSFCIAANL